MLIKNIFLKWLTDIVSASIHTKCMSISNKKCLIQSTLINLHPKEYSQKFQFYPFAVELDRWVKSCSNLNSLSNEVCDPNKAEH